MKLYRVLPLLAAALIAGCGGGDGAEAVPYQDVTNSVNGAFAEGTYVWRSQADLAAVWKPSPIPGAGPGTLPVVDFGSGSIVGVSLGDGIRCYVPQVTRVERSGDVLTVSWKSAGPNGPTTLACLHTWPLTVFVSIPLRASTVTFVRVDG